METRSRGLDSVPASDHCFEGCDGLITNQRDSALGVYVADCCAVYLVDRDSRAIGLVHSGKKGTALGIVRSAIKSMRQGFGIESGDLIVQLSPCIRPPHYEIDFAADIVRQCRDAGIEEIFDSGVCTACDLEHYYSVSGRKRSHGTHAGVARAVVTALRCRKEFRPPSASFARQASRAVTLYLRLLLGAAFERTNASLHNRSRAQNEKFATRFCPFVLPGFLQRLLRIESAQVYQFECAFDFISLLPRKIWPAESDRCSTQKHSFVPPQWVKAGNAFPKAERLARSPAGQRACFDENRCRRREQPDRRPSTYPPSSTLLAMMTLLPISQLCPICALTIRKFSSPIFVALSSVVPR